MKCLVTILVLSSLLALAASISGRPCEPAVAAASDTQTDVQDIQAWLERYCTTVTAGDLAGYRAFWTEDVVWLPPNAPVRKGIADCMEHNRPLFEYYQSVETMSAEEIRVEGNMAFARVNYTYQGTPKPGTNVEPLKEDGKGMFILQRRPDGSWVSTHCVWNSNLALPK